jgi:D-glycero-D-manno-heptose 1,7-bisphosphate phosphatase
MKLVVFDKDGTLTEPISGQTFVQSPQDQRLRPGVSEKLDQMRSEGWMMAIASNQGGCAIQSIPASKLRVGVWLHDVVRKVEAVDGVLDQPRFVTLSDGDTVNFLADEDVDISYKSIDDAIEEMKFALELTNIRTGLFCPDFEGSNVVCVRRSEDGTRCQRRKYIEDGFRSKFEDFRKPGGGMLSALKYFMLGDNEITSIIMVGDRAEDEGAAKAAGFEFQWANNFF